MEQGDDLRDILTARALRVPVDRDHPDPEILLHAATIIRHGGIVAYPTETYYGLAVDPFNSDAVQSIYRVKGRDFARALILLLSHTGQVMDVAHPKGPARHWFEKLARAFWPGPLTLVLPTKPRLACPALAGGETVAVRISSNTVAWQLARSAGRPITSTSANLAGGAPASSAEAIPRSVAARLNLILDAGPTPGGPASTLLDLTGDRPLILRPGRIAAEQISDVLGLKPRMGSAA